MEKITISSKDKLGIYLEILPQIRAVVESESDMIANFANIAAILKEAFDNFLWVGFYLVKPDDSEHGSTLLLGPYQGPLACTRIMYGRGVCGTAWSRGETIIVPDVKLFPGHIACSSLSRSEIVIPIFAKGQIIGVLDIDSEELGAFDEVDAKYLTQIFTDYYFG